MELLIDDTRDLGTDIIARNPRAAMLVLSFLSFEVIYFDHDLGDPILTGYDVLLWALQNDKISSYTAIQLVTSNPVGRERMKNLLQDHGYTTKNNVTFIRP